MVRSLIFRNAVANALRNLPAATVNVSSMPVAVVTSSMFTQEFLEVGEDFVFEGHDTAGVSIEMCSHYR